MSYILTTNNLTKVFHGKEVISSVNMSVKKGEQMADTIGVISNGKLIEEVSMENINGQQTEYIEIAVDNSKKAVFILENNLGISNFKVIENGFIRIYDSSITQLDISKAFILNDVAVESISKKTSSLEDYFLKLINGGAIHA